MGTDCAHSELPESITGPTRCTKRPGRGAWRKTAGRLRQKGRGEAPCLLNRGQGVRAGIGVAVNRSRPDQCPSVQISGLEVGVAARRPCLRPQDTPPAGASAGPPTVPAGPHTLRPGRRPRQQTRSRSEPWRPPLDRVWPLRARRRAVSNPQRHTQGAPAPSQRAGAHGGRSRFPATLFMGCDGILLRVCRRSAAIGTATHRRMGAVPLTVTQGRHRLSGRYFSL